MNRKEADAWVARLSRLLSGENLVSVRVYSAFDHRPQILVNQEYRDAWVVDCGGECVVDIADSCGVLPGIERFVVDPESRTLQMEWHNGFGKQQRGAYTLMTHGDDDTFQLWREAQRESRKETA